MNEELKDRTGEEAEASQKKAKKNGQEDQDRKVKGEEEGQPEDKVERAEEILDDSEKRPHQEEEVDGAGADIGKRQGGGKLR